MIQQCDTIITACYPSLRCYEHRQSSRFLFNCFLLGAQQREESDTMNRQEGEKQGKSFSCFSEQLFQQIILSPTEQREEKEQEDTRGRGRAFSWLEIIQISSSYR